MIEPMPQTGNRKCNHILDCTKSLSIPTLKNGTLFIGYLNAAISVIFIIVSSVMVSSSYYGRRNEYLDNDAVGAIILTIAIVSFLFTVALIAGTHKEKTLCMRVYFSFGVIGLMISIGALIVLVIIMASFGDLGNMIFLMQIFFFFGVYAIQLHVIQRTIEHFETPSIVQEIRVEDAKDTSPPPSYEYVPRLTVVT